MEYLSTEQASLVQKYLDRAAEVALNATCQRSKCGSVIVSNDQIIGEGFNSPAAGLESQRRCTADKSQYHRKVTDKTCCVHAEQRAIMAALSTNPAKINGSILYFILLDESQKPSFAGQPYCTICSKMALDAGVKTFVLWHQQGIAFYDTAEYNQLSYQYQD
jgi:deoxycytidylate deaminase